MPRCAYLFDVCSGILHRMINTRIRFEQSARTASGLAPLQRDATVGDTFLRAASAHRAQVQSPFIIVPQAFAARLRHAFLADAFEVAGTCRPTRLFNAALQLGFATQKAPAATTHQAQPERTLLRQLVAGMRHVPSLVGAAIGVVADVIVLAVVLTLALPAVLVHAIQAAIAPQGVRIDTRHVSTYDVELAYNATVRSGVREHALGEGTDGVAEQFKKDLPRQTMYISTGPDDAIEPLEQDYDVAMPRIAALCTDEAGVVDKPFLWAVTDMSAQGLLNGVYRELMQRHAVTYAKKASAPNFNGDTAHAVRKLSGDAVAIRSQMLMQKGLQVAVLGGAYAGGFLRDPTPMRLDVEVVVYKGCKEHLMPRVHVTELSLQAI